MENKRIWCRVLKTEGCWVWTGYINKGGYGQLWANGTTHTAHRFIYELLVGKILTGLDLDHLCRNRACVNPQHLEAVTRKVNILRGRGVAATNAAKEMCKNGHPFTPENTYRMKTGRACIECMRQNVRNFRRRQVIARIA